VDRVSHSVAATVVKRRHDKWDVKPYQLTNSLFVCVPIWSVV